MSRLSKILLVIMIAGILVGAFGAVDAYRLISGDITDINDIEPGDIRAGRMFDGEIDSSFDSVAEETATTFYGIIPVNRSKSPYYLIELENCYVVINVTSDEDIEKFKTLTEQTLDYLYEERKDRPDPVNVTLRSKRTPEKVQEYLEQYCQAMGMTDDEYSEFVENTYCFTTVDFRGIKAIPIIAFSISFICAAVLIYKKVTGPKIVNL